MSEGEVCSAAPVDSAACDDFSLPSFFCDTRSKMFVAMYKILMISYQHFP
jgi:hypothetical protein